MRYAITILLGNTKAFCEAYYIAAENSGGLKPHLLSRDGFSDYIAAGNSGGLKSRKADRQSNSNYIAAGNGGG